jgi:hypothetical protein
LSCSINPPSGEGDDGTDDSALDLTLLPSDLKAELALGKPGTGGRGEPWIKGLSYIPMSGYGAVARALGDETTVMDPLEPPNEDQVIFQPIAAGTTFSLSALSWQAEDFQDRVEQQMKAAIPAAIETEFWSGAIAQAEGYPNNYLNNEANVTNLTPGAGPVSVLAGLGMLQTALRKGMGGQGMVHVTPEAVPNLLNTRRAGKYLLDMFDNIIIPGVGYDGTGPGGSTPDAGTTFMYASDMVMCRVAKDIKVFPGSFAEALDRGQDSNPNLITFRAFQIFAAYFDGFRQFCVQVQLPS